MKRTFSLSARIKSFHYAGQGIFYMLQSQQNAWIHTVATVLVLVLSAVFGLTAVEWCLILLTVSLVWMAEAFNTALEFLADAALPQHHPLIGKAKICIVLVIFIPYFFPTA